MIQPAPLRVVLLEDDDADAALVTREVARSGIACDLTRVATGPAYRAALEAAPPDLILSDSRLEGYDGMSALRWARERTPDALFVFVSGTLGEEAAIEAMREGATDYVLKDRLARLGPVINRVMAELALRRELASIRAQHLHGQKLEAMGHMAAAVAHDFRNILTVMIGHTELLRDRLPPADPVRERLRSVLDAGRRGVDLTAQLLAFGRRETVTAVDLDPTEEVRRIETLFRSVLTRGVDLRIDAPAGIGIIHIAPGQFGQVMMNLLVNARDALPGGGQVVVSVSRRTLRVAQTYTASVAVPGEYVEIAVTDTGIGMTDEIQQRIFEPFFTTKSPEKGTGLGLATVFGIVRQAGGHLEVDSTPGAGTTFWLLFPRIRAAGEPDIDPMGASGSRRSGAVLVVEDDRLAREQIGQILELAGYEVLTAGNGLEAIEIARASPRTIALLLTDLHMPGMGGRELVEAFGTVRPQARILVMTGSPSTGDESGPASGPALIRKPFRPHDLLARVHGILAVSPGAGDSRTG